MFMTRHCTVCILNQIIRTADHLEITEKEKERIFSLAVKEAAKMDHREYTSPEFAARIYAVLARETRDPDPYGSLKREQNRMILDRIDFFRSRIAAAPDPLFAAALTSLLGNIIDLGAESLFDSGSVFDDLQGVELACNDFPRFHDLLAGARRMLVIADNAGEAVLDRLFIEEVLRTYPALRVGVAVRSAPAINDVVMEDALHAGLGTVAEVFPSGSPCAGTLLSRATPRFREWFDGAELVVSKGQGNFETLEDARREIFFMFRVKCPMVARFSGFALAAPIMAFRDSLRPVT